MSKFLNKFIELSRKLKRSASTEPKKPSSAPLKPKQLPKTELVYRQLPQTWRRSKRSVHKINRPLDQKPFFTESTRQRDRDTIVPIAALPPVTIAKKKYKSPLQSRRKRYLLILAGLGLGGGILGFSVFWLILGTTLPESTSGILTYARPGTLTIAAADGTILRQMGPATHEKLKIWEFPQPLVQAFIAIEDRRFYQHNGVDYQGILRAAVSNVAAQGVVEGGSTITQQLARIVFLDQERSFGRKLREFRVAQQIEQEMEKEQIIESYLNLVYLGEGTYGVADAAWVYFSKRVNELTLAEMALLAALPPAPNDYSPFVNREFTLQRRNLVLQRMQEAGYITESVAQAAIQEPLTLQRSRPRRLERQADYFTQYIQQELPKYVSPEVLQAGGVTIETTLNSEWQRVAENAVNRTIERDGQSARFRQAALVSIDPRNGHVKAMVGGRDFFYNQFNRATQAKRQPGSTFKAFVYTAAMAAGITPTRGYLDAPLEVDGYQPRNFGETYRGWVSMRDALISSINVVALKILIDVGWEPTIDIARRMGIESELQPIYSLALGGSEVTLLELTGAYGTLAANGVHTKPHGIRRILDREGNIIYQGDFKPQRAIEEDTAAIVTWMLRGVVNEGTGQPASLDRPVAGKTGTSDEARDLWFVGYIPQLVTGVWLGNDDNRPTRGSSSVAATTWRRFMSPVVKEMREESFPRRPVDLENRQPQIEVQPIRPQRIISGRSN